MKKNFIYPKITVSVFDGESVAAAEPVSGLNAQLTAAGVGQGNIKEIYAQRLEWSSGILSYKN